MGARVDGYVEVLDGRLGGWVSGELVSGGRE